MRGAGCGPSLRVHKRPRLFEKQPRAFTIICETGGRHCCNVLAKPSDTLSDIKVKIAREFKIDTVDAIFFAGQQLEDGRTLSDYNISDMEYVYM